MYTCSNDHIQISWEINVSCPVCYERKLHIKPKIDFCMNGDHKRLIIEKVGLADTYLHMALYKLTPNKFMMENYIQIMDLFYKKQ